MKRVKRRIWSGMVLEQEVYTVSERTDEKPVDAKPRLRFRDEAQRTAHREGIARREHARAFNANFSETSLYSTLTFDDAHELMDFAEAKRIRENYIRRLKRRYPDAVIFAYLGRGKTTYRIHMHMVSEGIPADIIAQLWPYGDIRRVEKLRESSRNQAGEDIGRDYTGLANYLFNHWTPEQGGHHYYKTRNAKACEKEDAAECRTSYSSAKPPRVPAAPEGYEWKLTDSYCTDYGYLWWKWSLVRVKRARKRE